MILSVKLSMVVHGVFVYVWVLLESCFGWDSCGLVSDWLTNALLGWVSGFFLDNFGFGV